MSGKTLCTCGHPLAIHAGACRLNSCGCRAFTETGVPKPTAARTVTLDIPDGYVLNVQLVPIEGGPVSPAAPYVVGEEGPELFVPTADGRVIPMADG